MMACGMNLGDYSCGDESKDILDIYPEVKGFGEIVLQSDDINNVTVNNFIGKLENMLKNE